MHTHFVLFRSDKENFCATVPKDGRSYSATLFSQTVRVLKKINKPGNMIVAFGLLADKIKVITTNIVVFFCKLFSFSKLIG